MTDPVLQPPLVVVVMGVSGSGKSTIGRLLAERWQCDFQDGDDLHPQANRDLMAAGHPLTDADRRPWLAAVRAWIDAEIGRKASGVAGVIACSALKVSYRDALRRPEVAFVYLNGSYPLIEQRLRTRHGHFMPAALLKSQFATLEPPGPGERVVEVDVALPIGELLDAAAAGVGLP